MTEVLKLALKIIEGILDIVHQTESGLVTPEQARARLLDFHQRIEAGDDAADKAVDDKFPTD
jgi:hypothetical protein